MGVRKLKPTSAGTRFRSVSDFSEVTKREPEKSLLEPLGKGVGAGGRNNFGHITAYRRGGGHKRKYRRVDFKRDKRGIPAQVVAIEYDPNRSARLALLHYADGEKRYILHPRGLEVGAKVIAGSGADIKVGNAVPLREVPLGETVHNIELVPGKGGQICRSAGSGAQVVAREGAYVTLKLPSTEVRKARAECFATIGYVGNVEHELVSSGKAGRSRWRGRRPIVRGVAMNPVDHPLGGGEGKSSGGRPACSPWGKREGRKTRKRHKESDALIVRPRRRGKATAGGAV